MIFYVGLERIQWISREAFERDQPITHEKIKQNTMKKVFIKPNGLYSRKAVFVLPAIRRVPTQTRDACDRIIFHFHTSRTNGSLWVLYWYVNFRFVSFSTISEMWNSFKRECSDSDFHSKCHSKAVSSLHQKRTSISFEKIVVCWPERREVTICWTANWIKWWMFTNIWRREQL